jgi:predicted nucleotide-binding protein (sugar kinase/HSP70/actin superfamily)
MSGNGRNKPKTVYIPCMCDHAHVLGAAMEVYHIPTEVLPPPDDETLAIGLDLCKGRECLPCFITTGDIIRRARQPDFDPAQSVLFMATTSGPCRFGQYRALQRNILDQQGLAEMDIISPNAANSYQGLGKNPTQLRALAWQGVVAVDLVQKLLHEHRPYEINPGQTDEIYQLGLERVVAATRAGGGKKLVEVMKWIAAKFQTLPVDRGQSRPLIGLVGEIYLRFNTYGNQDIVRQVEAAGGEVTVASMMEWFYFTNWGFKIFSQEQGNYLDFFKMFLTDVYQQHLERRLVKPVEHLLRNPHEAPIPQLMENIRAYYEPYLGTEAILSMSKAIDFARNGLCGILNVMPFSCMPGIITAGMASRLRADLDNIPWLDIIYDAQGETNINTRLEAFMYQAFQFQHRKRRHT